MSIISDKTKVTYFTCDCLDFAHTIRIVEYNDTDFESIELIAPIYMVASGITKLDSYFIKIYLNDCNLMSTMFYYLYRLLCFPISLYKLLNRWYIPVILQTDFINAEERQKFIDLTKKIYKFSIDNTVHEDIYKVKPMQISKRDFSFIDICKLALKGSLERYINMEYWIDKSDNNQYTDLAGNPEPMYLIKVVKER